MWVKTSKLILNLKDKKNYVVHYELLKYYENLAIEKSNRFIESYALNNRFS